MKDLGNKNATCCHSVHKLMQETELKISQVEVNLGVGLLQRPGLFGLKSIKIQGDFFLPNGTLTQGSEEIQA
ncbi:MAG: hypothetical protein HYS98_00065 [Deltaproteobacteria bacterium]|nr:hypothetical protein [Deltaproteobacteria bacterium]